MFFVFRGSRGSDMCQSDRERGRGKVAPTLGRWAGRS